MKPNNSISRSPINDSKVSAQDFPKSGFNLKYRSYKDFIFGRLHVGGFHHVMPGDKFSGANIGNFTLNQVAPGVPMLSPVSISQHNFLVTYRSIDTTFEDGQTPTRLNSMSASWHTPKLHLDTLVNSLLAYSFYASGAAPVLGVSDSLPSVNDPLDETSQDSTMIAYVTALKALLTKFTTWHEVNPALTGIYSSTTVNRASQLYLLDALKDVADFTYSWLKNIVFDGSITVRDAIYYQLCGYLIPFVGKGSLLCSFGYNYLRSYDIMELAGVADGSIAVIVDAVDDFAQCEYALRAYYAVWCEHYRDYNLEPRSSNLPWYRNFGGSSVFEADPLLLLTRVRSWSPDVFTSALPDDPSRHVFAPILGRQNARYLTDSTDYSNSEALSGSSLTLESRNLSSYQLTYVDSLTGSVSTLYCPLPSSVNDSLVGSSSVANSYALDLLTLRRSQMLEQYLKRNFYFGDEYADRLLAHYGSELSDYRINRPAVLSSSVDVLNNGQMKSQEVTIADSVGMRTAFADGNSGNDGYSSFAEEFGIVINMISFLPTPMYAGATMQNFLDVQTDFPLPEFANQNDEFGRVIEIATSGLKKTQVWNAGCFGHYPAYHAYRARVDHVQDSFLDDKQNWTFRRFFGLDSQDGSPKLNYEFIHCRPNLGMFINTVRLDGQLYGWIDHEFYAERVLPTPTEHI